MDKGPQAREGRTLAGRYRLDERIAVGGMAEVWAGTDLLLQRRVAVKILHTHLREDDALVRRFRREALAVARLRHQGIVAVYDTCSADDLDAIILELIPGPTLRQRLDDEGPMPSSEVVRLGMALASALTVAHAADLVHRDIKPANVLLNEDRVVLTDFGIAKALDDAERTSTGTLLGSARYLAPEQVEGGEVDARADIFSVGVVLYECLTGRTPWNGPTDAATALARLRDPPAPPSSIDPSLPAELEDLVMRCLQRDPADRPGSADELGQELTVLHRAQRTGGGDRARPLTAGRPSTDPDRTVATSDPTSVVPAGSYRQPTVSTPSTPRPGPAPSQPPEVSRRRWGWPVALAGLLLVAVIVAVMLIAETEPGQDVLGRAENALGGEELPIADVVPFDPEGTGEPGENDHLAPQAWDGDLDTSWQTVGYYERGFGIKRGVGLIIALDQQRELAALNVSSPTQGWAASVYVADQAGTVLEDWGDPVAESQDIQGDATFDLGGATGSHVLLWITDLGDGPPLIRAEVSDLILEG